MDKVFREGNKKGKQGFDCIEGKCSVNSASKETYELKRTMDKVFRAFKSKRISIKFRFTHFLVKFGRIAFLIIFRNWKTFRSNSDLFIS